MLQLNHLLRNQLLFSLDSGQHSFIPKSHSVHNTHDYQLNSHAYGRGRGRGCGYGNNRPQCQMCGKFVHLMHRCFQRFNVHFPDYISANLAVVRWSEKEYMSYPGPPMSYLGPLATSLPNMAANFHPSPLPILMCNTYIPSTTLLYHVLLYRSPVFTMLYVLPLVVVPITSAFESSPQANIAVASAQ